MQCRRDCERSRRHRGDLSARDSAFEDGLRQLFQEQRHAVTALDDLIADFAREDGLTGNPLDQRSTVALAEPVER